ncbi:MAG: methyltransferase [Chloroflexi bacterium]|nr:methyltransferase [Chloroflexota bacterium]
MDTSVTPDKIMQVGTGFWASKTLLSAIELELFTHLAAGPATMSALEKKLKLHPRSSRDFLDALVALGFLNREGDRYSNSPDTGVFLDKKKPSYIGGILEMSNSRLYPFWGSLTEGLHTGKPQNEAKSGGNFFEALYAEPARLEQFLKAMTGLSVGAGMAIAKKFPWAKYKTFYDVGGAQGAVAVQLALEHKHLTGGNFDLPPVGPIFEKYVESFKLSNRLKFVGGSFFTDPLPKVDVIVMGHILHDWDLDEKRMLLQKAYDAVPKGGAVIVFEAIIDDERRQNAFGLLMSLNMLIETPGGFDYTGADCSGWMREAGFKDTRVEHLIGPDSMVVGIK